MSRRFLLAIFALVALPSLARGGEFRVPPLTSPVMDEAGLMDKAAAEGLSSSLHALHQSGGSQITVLTLSSLGGLPIEMASIKITDQWKLGDATRDNGVLLLVAKEERRVRIEVGQGLEGSLTDLHSRRVIDDTITPFFREGRFSEGIVAGVVAIARLTDPDKTLDLQASAVPRGNSPFSNFGRGHSAELWIAGLILAALFWLATTHPWIFVGLLFFGIPVFLFLLALLARHLPAIASHGSYGYHSGDRWSGGGWSGRGGGGGWSGGGGGFSGGGASGSW
jgi:uncharacterized protein